MTKLGDVLGGGQGLKNYAGQTLTIDGYLVEEGENGQESVAIHASNGDAKSLQIRTTSGVVIRQLAALKANDLLPATVTIEEKRSSSGRSYLNLAEPEDAS
jgi:hypothetical protein